MEQLIPMIKDEAGDGDDDVANTDEEDGNSDAPNKIFREPPHFTFKKYFSGNKVLNLLGGHDFGATITTHRDHLTEGVSGVHIYKEKTEAKSRKSRIARFNNSTTMVNESPPTDEMKGYTRIHSTFQYTYSYNITTVNAIHDNNLYVKQKERGRGTTK
jgi:hypothetical protein